MQLIIIVYVFFANDQAPVGARRRSLAHLVNLFVMVIIIVVIVVGIIILLFENLLVKTCEKRLDIALFG